MSARCYNCFNPSGVAEVTSLLRPVDRQRCHGLCENGGSIWTPIQTGLRRRRRQQRQPKDSADVRWIVSSRPWRSLCWSRSSCPHWPRYAFDFLTRPHRLHRGRFAKLEPRGPTSGVLSVRAILPRLGKADLCSRAHFGTNNVRWHDVELIVCTCLAHANKHSEVGGTDLVTPRAELKSTGTMPARLDPEDAISALWGAGGCSAGSVIVMGKRILV